MNYGGYRIRRAIISLVVAGILLTGSRATIASDNSAPASDSLSEIVVTAEKREERLQDVPVPVTSLSADALAENNQLRLQDYFSAVPGLSLASGGDASSLLVIRGLTTGSGNPTVSVLVDDVPVSSSSQVSDNSNEIPDLDPSDLARVEVLRGPQGTLYGASSLGGIIKFVTADPSTDTFGGRIQVDSESIRNGDGLGYGVRGSVNVPITDTMAIRASGFVREDPGYIDNPALGLDGVNKEHAQGGHLSALWKPSDAFSLKLGALVQDANAPSTSLMESGLGDLQQSFMPTPWGSREHLYTATVNAALGSIKLTSVSGYSDNEDTTGQDFSDYLGPGTSVATRSETKKFSEEFRLSSSIGQTLDWLAGAFYTHEHTGTDQTIPQLDVPGATNPIGVLAHFHFPNSFERYAGFADLTVHFTDRIDVQFGGRESENRQVINQTNSGPYAPIFDDGYGGTYVAYPPQVTKDNSFTYLVTPRFRISQDLMLYARLASGYRPGGPNVGATAYNVPPSFGPDKTKNYEVGFKGDTLGHELTFDASVYYIDWKNIQLGVTSPTTGELYFTNGGGAKSQGIELSAEVRPLRGLAISGWFTFNDAVLTQNLGSGAYVQGSAGDRLPYSSRYAANLAIEQTFPLGSRLDAYVRGSVAYVGDRETIFSDNPVQPRIIMPSYARPNLLAGVKLDSWNVSLAANNITDKRAYTSAGYLGPTATPLTYGIIQPRTFVLSIAYKF